MADVELQATSDTILVTEQTLIDIAKKIVNLRATNTQILKDKRAELDKILSDTIKQWQTGLNQRQCDAITQFAAAFQITGDPDVMKPKEVAKS